MPEKTLEKWSVKDICNLVAVEPAVVSEDCSWNDLLVELLEHPSTRHVYVVDENGRLRGVVRLNDLVQRLFPYARMASKGEAFTAAPSDSFDADRVSDIMSEDPCFVTEETPVGELIEIMVREDVSELPVVGAERRVSGEVNVLEIIAGYLRAKDQ
jgi:CBS domain-containing protein